MTLGIRLTQLLGLLFLLAEPTIAWAQATDVDCDKCVNTSDLASGSINTKKIKNGTITKADIAADTITSGRIKDGTLVNADLAANTIKSSRIKDGTITNVDIAANTIAGSRIKNGTVTNADLADGTILGSKLASNAVFNSIIVINTDPADPVGNCTELSATLAMFDPANTVRTLIKLEPGIYDCRNGGPGSGLVMKPFVDIEGSGQGITRILGDSIEDAAGVIQTASNTELRFLTLENTNTDVDIFPHVLYVPTFIQLSFVTLISADTGDGANEPIDCSLSIEPFPAVIMNNSIVIATGDEATYSCAGGVYVATEIDSINGMGSGTHICHGSFDESFEALNTNCELPIL
jgi:hypothetical protein